MKIPMENLPYIGGSELRLVHKTQQQWPRPVFIFPVQLLLPDNIIYETRTHTCGYSLDCAPLFSRTRVYCQCECCIPPPCAIYSPNSRVWCLCIHFFISCVCVCVVRMCAVHRRHLLLCFGRVYTRSMVYGME